MIDELIKSEEANLIFADYFLEAEDHYLSFEKNKENSKIEIINFIFNRKKQLKIVTIQSKSYGSKLFRFRHDFELEKMLSFFASISKQEQEKLLIKNIRYQDFTNGVCGWSVLKEGNENVSLTEFKRRNAIQKDITFTSKDSSIFFKKITFKFAENRIFKIFFETQDGGRIWMYQDSSFKFAQYKKLFYRIAKKKKMKLLLNGFEVVD